MNTTTRKFIMIFAHNKGESILPTWRKLYGTAMTSVVLPPNNTEDVRMGYYQSYEITWTKWKNIDQVRKKKFLM